MTNEPMTAEERYELQRTKEVAGLSAWEAENAIRWEASRRSLATWAEGIGARVADAQKLTEAAALRWAE
jgi:hypothetical protein